MSRCVIVARLQAGRSLRKWRMCVSRGPCIFCAPLLPNVFAWALFLLLRVPPLHSYLVLEKPGSVFLVYVELVAHKIKVISDSKDSTEDLNLFVLPRPRVGGIEAAKYVVKFHAIHFA